MWEGELYVWIKSLRSDSQVEALRAVRSWWT